MWLTQVFRGFVEGLFQGNYFLAAAFLFAFGCLLLAAVCSFLASAQGLDGYVCAVLIGVFSLTALSQGGEFLYALKPIAVLSVFGGAMGAALLLLLKIKFVVATRKQRRAQKERSLLFALPKSDNALVRSRLSTVLRIPEERGLETEEEIPLEELPKLSHARELLAKVKAAPLCGAERLEVEELSKTLYAFVKKERVTTEDFQLLNDAFSRVLKLSAKYAI